MKNKEFIPFANATEYFAWQTNNCDICVKYETESSEVEKAGCKLAFFLDLASVSEGVIALSIAKKIGIENNKLVSKCKKLKT